MSQQNIDFGSFPNDPSADAIQTAFLKVQNNFNQLFSAQSSQAVVSVNRTPGAGINVINGPAGNVVLGANIANVTVATTTLALGRDGPNTSNLVTITSSAQTLFIDLPSTLSNISNLTVSNRVTAGHFSGEAGNLSNIQGSNISGAVSSATTAGTVTTAAQPNITSVGTLSALSISGNLNSGNANLGNAVNANYFIGSGNNLSNIQASNISGTIANANYATYSGTVLTNAQPNITSVGTLSSLTVSGNLTAGNLLGKFANGNSNVSIPAANGNVNISAVGNANILVVTGTGVNVAGTLNATGNANVGNIGATNGVFTNVSGNGSALSSLTAANITGQVANATIAGTVYTNAQPNITSVGTLTSLSVTGNISSGNVNANFFGNGTGLTGLVGANVTGTVGFANVAYNVSGSNVTGAVAYATTANSVAGSNVNGAVNLANYATTANAVAGANVSGIVANANYSAYSGIASVANSVAGANVTGAVAYAAVANSVAGANVSGTVANATYALNAGNATVASSANSVAGANVTGTVANATYALNAGNATVASSANSVAGANVTGTVANATYALNAGNATVASTANSVAGANVSGAVAYATTANAVAGANVSGTVANATYATSAGSATTAGTVTTNAQPNITSVGTLSSLAVTGNITAGNVNTTGQLVSTVATGTAPFVVSSTTTVANLSATTATTAATVTTNAQPNITSVGTLTSLTISGNTYSGGIGLFQGFNAASNLQFANLTLINPLVGGSANNNNYVQVFNFNSSNGTQASTDFIAYPDNGNTNSGYIDLGITSSNFNTGAYAITGKNEGYLFMSAPNGSGASGNLVFATDSNGTYNSFEFFVGGLAQSKSNRAMLLSTGGLTVSNNIVTGNLYSNSGIIQAQYLYGDGSNITNVLAGANTLIVNGNSNASLDLNGNFNVTVSGNANVLQVTGNSVVASNYVGNIRTASQPYITSLGTLTTLNVSGKSNLNSVGNVTITGGVANAFLMTDGNGNLSFNTGSLIPVNAGGANTQIQYNNNNNFAGSSAFTFNSASNVLTLSGNANIGNLGVAQVLASANVTAPQFISNVANGTAPIVVTSQTRVPNLNVDFVDGYQTDMGANANTITIRDSNASITANIFYGKFPGANVTGTVANANYSTYAGTLLTNAQPNITSVGTLSSLAVTGNITSGNVYANSGTIGSAHFVGEAGNLSNIQGANVSGAVTYATTANNVAGGNVTGAVASASALLTNTSSATTAYPTFVTSSSNGYSQNYINSSLSANLANGALIATTFAGNATTAGTVTTAAQPNITSVGTLTSLTSSGTITANSFTGNANGLSNIPGANVTGAVTYATTANAVAGANVSGQVGNALVAGTVYTNAQPNITSVGTLSSLGVTGNITTANSFVSTVANGTAPFVISSQTRIANLNADYVDNYQTALNATASTLAVRDTNASLTANVFIGNIAGANVTGAVTYATTANAVAAGNLTGSTLSSNVTNSSLTSLGTLSALNVTGNANVGNIGAGTGVFTAGITDVSGTGYALRVVNPGGASYATSTSAVSGAIKITLPQGYTNTMMLMTVTVYTYDGQAFEINLGGYNYLPSPPGWYSTFADITTNSRPALNVRFGFDGTYCCIYIGETSTVWSYPQVFVTEFQAGYSNCAASQWNTGWSVSFATTLLNVTSTVNTASMVLYANGSGLTSLTGSNVTGTVAYATTANSVAGANVSGQVSYAAVANSVAGGNVSGAVGLATYATTANAVAGANVSGQVGNALVAGTVYTNAQPNITSVGTLTSLTVTGNIGTGNLNTSSGTVGGASATLYGTTLTTGANTTAGSITGNWTLSAGSKLTATYADLGEYYAADGLYEPGTVLMFGGSQEVTIADEDTNAVAGVVSTNPAYVMNGNIQVTYPVVIALQGRVPVKVKGVVRKGNIMVSAGNGYAKASSNPLMGTAIGKALADFDGSEGVIEIAVGRL